MDPNQQVVNQPEEQEPQDSPEDLMREIDNAFANYNQHDIKQILGHVETLVQNQQQPASVSVNNLHEMPQPILRMPNRFDVNKPDWLMELVNMLLPILKSMGDKDDEPMATKIDDFSDTVTYIGCAKPGSKDNAAVWQIQRTTTQKWGVEVEWADGDANYDNVWDDREHLEYK